MKQPPLVLDHNLVIRTEVEHNEYVASLEKKYENSTLLSILIATTKDRRLMFNGLCQELYNQIELNGHAGIGIEEWYVKVPTKKEDGSTGEGIAKARYRHKPSIEILFEEDEKQMSIGAKRQKLLERAKGEYIVYFDSDDYPKPNYIKDIAKALEVKPDCLGFKIEMTTNGKNKQTCIHSLSYKNWHEKGGVYYRNVTHFNPVKRELALQVGFKDLRFGEDKDYSDRLTLLCHKEIFIDEFLFEYRYTTGMTHKEKYG